MAISVLSPVGDAIDQTKRILFSPFDLGKWFVLGFCAFLANLGGDWGSSSGDYGNWGGDWPPGPFSTPGEYLRSLNLPEQSIQWLNENSFAVVLSVIFVITVAAVLFGALLLWLRCRGRFMFIDGIVMNQGAVVRPWRDFRECANSLFMFKFFMSLVAIPLAFVYVAGALALAWDDIQAEEFGAGGAAALGIFIPLLILTLLALAVVAFLLRHFVVPVMYLHRTNVMEAWSTAWSFVIRGHVGTIFLFFLMRIVLGIAIGIIAAFATCATACIAAIPYIGTVILLPLFVFSQAYSLYFLAQFGNDWNCFAWDRDQPEPPEIAPIM